jgi:L-ascorbate metabolism protein UlaG (beta-lactamase superfamily)
MQARLTHIGGPTVLLEVGGWRLLTDPTFDRPGQQYRFGWGTGSTKLVGPAVDPEALLPVDAVLLTHDHHDDNLDSTGRALLEQVPSVITTAAGARRLGERAYGLTEWQSTALQGEGRADISVTATPCRHGPPLSRPIVGPVIGFALSWPGQTDGVLWISGDTVLYDAVRHIGERLRVDTAVLHLGGVQFPITGPLRYTMTGQDAVELIELVRPRQAIPVHYEGWKHFRQGRDAVEHAFDDAPADVRDRVRWLPIGSSVQL